MCQQLTGLPCPEVGFRLKQAATWRGPLCVCLSHAGMEISSVPIGKRAGPVSSASQLCPSRLLLLRVHGHSEQMCYNFSFFYKEQGSWPLCSNSRPSEESQASHLRSRKDRGGNIHSFTTELAPGGSCIGGSGSDGP